MRVFVFRSLATSFLLIMALNAVAQQEHGLKPRNAPSDYPAVRQEQNATFGADLLSQQQMKRALSTELYRRYIVVEIGVFPRAGETVNFWPEDFVLRNDTNGEMLRAAGPATVARVLQKDPAHAHEAQVAPEGRVGYSSAGVEPNGTHTGGWYGGVGTAVWVDKNPVGSTPEDREELEKELSAKEIPTGETTKAIAGYLYFPMPSKVTKRTKYALHYSRNGQQFVLALPPAH